MRKLMLIAALALVSAGSLLYANQDSTAEIAAEACGTCCPTDPGDCCTK